MSLAQKFRLVHLIILLNSLQLGILAKFETAKTPLSVGENNRLPTVRDVAESVNAFVIMCIYAKWMRRLPR